MAGKLPPGIQVRRDYARDLPRIEAHGSELNQVWTHLLDNAAYALAGQGTILLRTRSTGDGAIVEVQDDGPGIDAAVLPHIFDPFFTTRPVGDGAGLGLTISHTIVVQRHRGKIGVRAERGRTCFEVWLPSAHAL
jgi:signal transduction histidine kinase